jgi:hypothetical protein
MQTVNIPTLSSFPDTPRMLGATGRRGSWAAVSEGAGLRFTARVPGETALPRGSEGVGATAATGIRGSWGATARPRGARELGATAATATGRRR